MNILESLKTIGLHFPNLKNIKLLNFSFNIDKSVHVHADGSTLTVNPGKLSAKQLRELKHILRTDVLDEAGAIVDERNSPTILSVEAELPAMEESVKKFALIVPIADMPLLMACLYLRRRFEGGSSVDDLKGQIARVYGQRGRNLSNLCSAGYLESWFLPLYQDLLTESGGDPALAKLKFQVIYGTILNELPFTEFVATNISKAKTLSHIVEKMNGNIANGVMSLNIHGLGSNNVSKVASILPEIMKQTGANITREEKDAGRIFVRLEIPPKKLTN